MESRAAQPSGRPRALPGGAGAALVVLLVPMLLPPVAAETPAPPAEPLPDWFAAGLETGLEDLWMEPPGAIAETAEPIDHGDVWAWTGDNAKFLGAEAEAQANGAGSGSRPEQMKDFLLRMRDGPLVFKRWANAEDPVVVAEAETGAELSNHLLTLRVDKGAPAVSAELEYHDGRDKAMASWGAPQVLLGDRWTDLATAPKTVTVAEGSDWVAVRIRYEPAGLVATQELRLDGAAAVHHSFVVEQGRVGGVRLPMPDLTIRRTGLPDAAYGHAYWPGRSLAPATDAAASGGTAGRALDWMMLLDPGTSDEFASGLLLRAVAPSAPATLQLKAGTGADGEVGVRSATLSSPGGGPGLRVAHDAVLLDGVLTGHLARYGDLAERLGDPDMAGVDPGLSYEYSETVLGLLQYARAAGDGEAAEAAEELFGHYLGFYGRGTQTRSLAAAVMTALLLAEVTGEERWLETAGTLGDALHGYQVQGKAAEAGSVLNEPGGGPFLDSTVMAARAWGALAKATGDAEAQGWADAAWGSLDAETDHVFIRGDRADDNEWTFKTGLILQGAPDVPPAILWAARNHAWVALRDLDAFEFRTSRYSAETNSETQAWMMLGLLADRRSEAGPWILDAEGYVPPWSPQPDGRWRLDAPWNGSYLWVERGWLAYSDGALAVREEGPHDSWRVTTGNDVVLAASTTHRLGKGDHTFRFPALARATPLDVALAGLPVEVAWSFDAAAGAWAAWRPGDGDSTLATVGPGQALLVRLAEPGRFEAPRSEAPPEPGWDLAAAGAPAGAGEPPMLVLGRIVAPYPHRLHGGEVTAVRNGTLVGQAWIDVEGHYRLLAQPAGSGELVLEHRAPDGSVVGLATVGFVAGGVAQPAVGDPADARLGRAPPQTMLAVLVASLVAAVMLALAVRRAPR